MQYDVDFVRDLAITSAEKGEELFQECWAALENPLDSLPLTLLALSRRCLTGAEIVCPALRIIARDLQIEIEKAVAADPRRPVPNAECPRTNFHALGVYHLEAALNRAGDMLETIGTLPLMAGMPSRTIFSDPRLSEYVLYSANVGGTNSPEYWNAWIELYRSIDLDLPEWRSLLIGFGQSLRDFYATKTYNILELTRRIRSESAALAASRDSPRTFGKNEHNAPPAIALKDRVTMPATHNGQSGTSAVGLDFFELGDEICALATEPTTRLLDIWPLVGQFEKLRRGMFAIDSDPATWSGCDLRFEQGKKQGDDSIVLVTAHPTKPNHYHTARVYLNSTLDDSAEREILEHIRSIASGWLRAGRRTNERQEGGTKTNWQSKQRICTKLELDILRIVGLAGRTITNVEIHAELGTDSDIKTTKETVKKLVKDGFLWRPQGERKGVALTDLGKQAIQ